MTGQLSRRHFLAALSALAGAGLLPGCTSNGSDDGGRTEPTSTRAFDGGAGLTDNPAYAALRELQALVRTSPDHLRARAEALVSARDLDAIVEFVRSEITVLPSAPNRDPLTDAPFGARGALRCAAGTLRDRIELAASLLEKAGFTVTRGSMTRPEDLDAHSLYAVRAREMDVSVEEIASIAARAGTPVEPLADEVDVSPLVDELDRIVDQLWGLVPADARHAMGADLALPPSVPILQVDTADGTVWVVAIGDEGIRRSPPPGLFTSLADAAIPQVEVIVEALMQPPPDRLDESGVVHELVRGTWTAAELAGRQVVVGYPIPGDLAPQVFTAPLASDPRFATLRLMAVDDIGDTMPAFVGQAISGGAVLATEDPAAPTGDTAAQALEVRDEQARAGLRTDVAQITATADATAFPSVGVALDVRDVGGAAVVGLAAADFELREDGVRLPFVLTANSEPPTPRVLIVYDGSGSVSEFWTSAEARASFEHDLAAALTDVASRTPILTQVVALGTDARSEAWSAPDAGSLQSALAAVTLSTSDVWRACGELIPRSGATIALLVSDCVSTLEEPDDVAAWKAAISAAGVPIVVIPVGVADQAASDEIVQRSGGIRVEPNAPGAVATIAGIIEERAKTEVATAYRLRFFAPVDGAATRALSIAVAGRPDIQASASYDVPGETDRAVPPGVVGLYVTVSIGGRRARRRLGGVPLSDRDLPTARPTSADAERCDAALLGIHTIAFEPERPTAAHLIDDAIAAMLTLEGLEAAWPSGEPGGEPAPTAEDATRIVEALPDVRWFPMPSIFLHNDPTPDDGVARTRELGVVVYHAEPTDDGARLATDVIPHFNRSRSARDEASVRSVLRASVLSSVRETVLGEQSALSALEGHELLALQPNALAPTDWPLEHDPALDDLLTEYPDWIRLVPRDGSVAAMWVIDPESGAATAVGELGAGTGVRDCKGDPETVQELNLALLGISTACVLAGNASVIQVMACDGFTVFGAYVLARGSFDTPINFGFALNAALGLYSVGTMLKASDEADPNNWKPGNFASRAVSAAVQAMLSIIAMGTWSD